MGKIRKLSIAILFLFFILPSANAISLGSVVRNDHMTISYNESAKFKLLFWNTENASYKVELSVKEMPKDWTVIIQPKEFFLNSTTGEEYIKLPYMEESARAVSASVFAKPNNNENGIYYITVIARAGLPSDIGISTFQERQFKLAVDVTNGINTGNQTGNENSELGESNPMDKIVEQKSHSYILYIIIILGVFLVSFIIYKYA